MAELDPRLNACRADLASESLRGRVEAARFVPGEPAWVCRGVADLRRAPDPMAPLDSQLLYGEPVACFERADGWAWVQSGRDGYVGYVDAAALAEGAHSPTHTVAALRTLLFPKPDLKAPILDALSMTSLVAVTGRRGDYCELAGGGWVHAAHLAELDRTEPDYVATALRFVGAPYLWGGRSSLGLDCSGLVQVAVHRAGLPCPRDTDMQAASLGAARPWDPAAHPPAYGDLLYMPGHVAFALDATRIVHATAHGLAVRIEPLADLIDRVRRDGGDIELVRRPAG